MDFIKNGGAPLPVGFKIFGFEIRFYALFILGGAILAYFLAKRYLKKEGFEDISFLENTFYIAFPAGIIGARIWYVICEWNTSFSNQPWYKVFAIWEGGLAIHGGVLLGIVVGMLYVMHKKPHYNVLKVASAIVPIILLSQAIGRFGNFFNCEVYGGCIDRNSIWLPEIIKDQLMYNSNGIKACAEGQIVTPLFLIEGIINLAGFFIIMYGVRLGLKKFIKNGDLIGCYFVWYGTVRAILEPLRDKQFQMSDNLISVWTSIFFIILGITIIILCHVFSDKINEYYTKKQEEYEKSLVLETTNNNNESEGINENEDKE